MAKKTGTIIIVIGLICLISAFGFYLHNQNESKTAGESARKVLEGLDEAVEEKRARVKLYRKKKIPMIILWKCRP